jgi:hypothetical protein
MVRNALAEKWSQEIPYTKMQPMLAIGWIKG